MVKDLKDSGTLAMIVVGFPCGGNTTEVKCREAEDGLKRGASDLDMVMNVGAFKTGDCGKPLSNNLKRYTGSLPEKS